MPEQLALTIAEVEALGPCEEDTPRVLAALRRFNPDPAHRFTAAEARAAGCTFNDLLWVAYQAGARRRLRLFTADCAAWVLHILEREHPSDHRVRAAKRAWQFDRLIQWLSNPEPEPLPLPHTERAAA